MEIDVLFAGVRVLDLERARSWYARLLGRDPDIVVNDDEVMWRIADAAWLYLLASAERAGGSVVTICVPDLDATTAEVTARGVTIDAVEDVGDAGRKASMLDPDGNSVAIIEVG
jgi:catechol 2,3-dioxygenase-like lactoylglutathione lyase family enzyme